MSQRQKSGGLVYSTAHGRMCPGCAKPLIQCQCRQSKGHASPDGIARVRFETKGRRKGKGVTVVSGLAAEPDELLRFAKSLKQRCGSGGTVKDGQIEIQGDHRAIVTDELQRRGWKFKLVGG